MAMLNNQMVDNSLAQFHVGHFFMSVTLRQLLPRMWYERMVYTAAQVDYDKLGGCRFVKALRKSRKMI